MDFKGLDHVVFTTSNMERAVGFYNELLGMPIIHATEYEGLDDDGKVSSQAQHFYFGVGGDNPEAHIAIFAFKELLPESGVARDMRQPVRFFTSTFESMRTGSRSTANGFSTRATHSNKSRATESIRTMRQAAKASPEAI